MQACVLILRSCKLENDCRYSSPLRSTHVPSVRHEQRITLRNDILSIIDYRLSFCFLDYLMLGQPRCHAFSCWQQFFVDSLREHL